MTPRNHGDAPDEGLGEGELGPLEVHSEGSIVNPALSGTMRPVRGEFGRLENVEGAEVWETADPQEALPDGFASEADEARPYVKPKGLTAQMFKVFIQNRVAVVFFILLVAITLFSFVGPLFYHTNQTDLAALQQVPNNLPPGAGHPLGTDFQGFDMLGRLMVGGRNSLIVGFLAAGMAMIIGVGYGVFSGYNGGRIDDFLMRILDVLLSIPGLFLVLAAISLFGRNTSMMILVIGLTGWYGVARLLRSEALTLREREYAQAVRSMGGKSRRIIWRHIIPNSISTTVTLATFAIGDSILALAALGFLGFGIQTPSTDWGTILNNGYIALQLNYWWELWPATILFLIVVMSFNYIGDALRDALEVRLRER